MKKKIIQSMISVILVLVFILTDWTVVFAATLETSIKLNSSTINLSVKNGETINRN